MNLEWTPVIVALVSGALLLPPAVLSLLASRSEPRRTKELQAVNAILKELPDDDDSFTALSGYRTRLATAYSERSVDTDPGLLISGILAGGWVLSAAGGFVLSAGSRPIEEVVGTAVTNVAIFATFAGFAAITIGILMMAAWFVALIVRARRRLRRRLLLEERQSNPALE